MLKLFSVLEKENSCQNFQNRYYENATVFSLTPNLTPYINADCLSTSAEHTQQVSQMHDYKRIERNSTELVPVYE